jgi:small redox-active disulfide protein 2
MLNIQVAGPGCKNCVELEARVKQAVAELGLEATVSKITGYQEIAASGVMMTPGLIVDGKVVLQGKLPTVGIVKNLLTDALAKS